MASQRQIHVGSVPIGGGAPVAVQTMTKTETANLTATMDQIRTVAEAGADIVRVAVPRDKDVEALVQVRDALARALAQLVQLADNVCSPTPQRLPLDDARRLRERLIQHAVDTGDHTLSDEVVRLLRGRLAAEGEIVPTPRPST